MASSYTPVPLAKDQPILRRRRRRPARPADVQRLQRDFWKHFDIDKFAADWRRGLGKRSAA